MSNITAQMVANLREITGLGMMECKKALVEAEGDLKKAEEILRIKSGAKAGKVAGRIAAEGGVFIYVSSDNKKAAIVEINCETDFVAKDSTFTNFASLVAQVIVEHNLTSIDAINAAKLVEGITVEEKRKEIVAKLGENISIRRFELLSTTGNIATYLHGKKIGVVVDLHGGNNELGRDIAMHIAASKPVCVSKTEVPSSLIETERHVYTQQAESSGKSAEIIAKMVEGRINKYLAEVTLLGQPFVKNPEITVEKLLQSHNAKVIKFTMFIVGEGIEKKVIDFAEEVASIVNS